jgi:6-phosphogluconate dehydrogenase
MQLGMIGLGRMGANTVRRLLRNGHECVVYDLDAGIVKQLEQEGATGAASLAARHRSVSAHAGTPGRSRWRRARLPPLRTGRRRPLVKMVHNGIEYGLMAAYAEGFGRLRHANADAEERERDAETTPLEHPEHFRYEFDLAEIAELWRRGSVIGSSLLDLSASALRRSPELGDFSGRVSGSGEGRWTLQAAVEAGVPAPVLGAALFERSSSRDAGDFANKLLSAMRFEFHGHEEKKAGS